MSEVKEYNIVDLHKEMTKLEQEIIYTERHLFFVKDNPDKAAYMDIKNKLEKAKARLENILHKFDGIIFSL